MTPSADLIGLEFTTADLDRAEEAYAALGFAALGRSPMLEEEIAALGLGSTRGTRLKMRLGAQEIAFTAFDPPGRPYPPDSTSTDLWFQHIAIAVSDMEAAVALARSMPGMTPITVDGPQRLPPNTGEVTAFKFRDHEGHPLELLRFPPGTGDPVWQERGRESPCLGIDHSALSVGDLGRSLAFYSGLGFGTGTRSRNRGPGQDRLDRVAHDLADVVALSTASRTPHVELLAYHAGKRRPVPAGQGAADIAATRMICRSVGEGPALRRDPDGHLIVLQGGG